MEGALVFRLCQVCIDMMEKSCTLQV